ncbi:hypothetical protein [Chryseobacterium aquaticum]|uniref:Uncharacterized protein n=1 Tax=Chryseobacterium aquaticum subsp. greenlandense TaxID=345663 RepID=A0A101CD29_9FLAO|nr:hypothetical protein [Chryseobacterium aquaticum]KUJ54004.1 hypothetical protein AR686_17610 [Chryseobacterium aquaticum subsp. greenlandense]
MDFTKETNAALEKLIAEKLPQMIEDKAGKMVEDIVSDIFRWGDVKKQIKEKIESSIQVNLQEFDLIDYNALIAKTINENLVQQINLQPILDMTQDIIGFVNQKEISLEAIAEMFIQASQEENETDGEGEITFITEEKEGSYISVYADIEPDKDKHSCAVQFCFNTNDKRDGKIFLFRNKDEYWDSKQKPLSPARLVNMNTLVNKIFRLYSAQVRITDYNHEPSTYWDRY